MQDLQPIRNWCSSFMFNTRNFIPRLKLKSKAEAWATGKKKHSEAEKRRRMRINGQYATLRAVLPNLIKMDKASVLTEALRRVLELKKAASELEAACIAAKGDCLLPNAVDGLSLSHSKGEKGVLKATICCEDRVTLVTDIARAMRSVEGKVVKAEMVSLGGRTKFVMWVKGLESGNEGIGLVRKALKLSMETPGSSRNHRSFVPSAY